MVAFRQKAPASDVNILLKPATRATLKAFLANSLQTTANQAAGPQMKSIRADRDEMLQCLIQTNLKLQEYDQERTNFLARSRKISSTPKDAGLPRQNILKRSKTVRTVCV